MIANAVKQTFSRAGDGYELVMTVSPQPIGELTGLTGVLVADPGFGTGRAVEIDVPLGAQAAAARTAAAGFGLVGALLLAFAGGLILNLMPCVFPILAIKVLGLVAAGARSARAVAHAWPGLFAPGVVLSFLALAGLLLVLRAGGRAWAGVSNSSRPAVVAALAVLFFVIGLNLRGVFEFGVGCMTVRLASGARAIRSPTRFCHRRAGGCRRVALHRAVHGRLARPGGRTAGAAGAGRSSPRSALGLALPYLAAAWCRPGRALLPRPGAWMDTFRKLLAFPMFATVAWLVWVLGQQAASMALARCWRLAAWRWRCGVGALAQAAARARSPCASRAAALAAGALHSPGPSDPALHASRGEPRAWRAWSKPGVRRPLAAGEPVFVDFTAAWCVTCQYNKKTTLLNASGWTDACGRCRSALLRADWTRRDPAITAALARMNRSGVPVYALYLPAQREPVLLPEVLTRNLVLDALQGAATQAARTYTRSPGRTLTSVATKEPQ